MIRTFILSMYKVCHIYIIEEALSQNMTACTELKNCKTLWLILVTYINYGMRNPFKYVFMTGAVVED